MVVRVNDRGPFHKGRIIDLSYTAAHKLGYINAGSAEVEIEQILPDEVPMMAAAKPVPPLPGPPLPGRTPVAVAETPAPASPPLAAVESRTLAPLEPAPQASPSMPAAEATANAEGDGLVPHIASASAGIFLQLGAFASRANAEGFRATVEREVAEHAERLELFADGERFRLHAGPYDTVDAARAAAERIGSTLQLKPFVVVR
ncbi:RlpA-like double-psi beta-barrel domain-containing protein [Thauera humireducens]|uniref:RlpA-like double-psi beta-barrel domain-containing protein n=1 Tax=Thauera humireducens TaxID=1134435 RepID=UPI00311E9424